MRILVDVVIVEAMGKMLRPLFWTVPVMKSKFLRQGLGKLEDMNNIERRLADLHISKFF